jgi:hypothetical protein
MASTARLEDLRKDWQQTCQPLLAEPTRAIMNEAARLFAESPTLGNESPAAADLLTQRLSATIADETRRFTRDVAVERCRDWLRDQRHWPEAGDRDERAVVELQAALQHVPTVEPILPQPVLTIPVSSYALTALLGGVAGVLLFGPLSLLIVGQREFGLAVGGPCGAAAAVAAVGWLAHVGAVRTWLTRFVQASAVVAVVRTGLRSRVGIAGIGAMGVAALLWWLARPRPELPNREDYLRQFEHMAERHLQHALDLVLAWCWAHPDRVAAPASAETTEAPIPGPICEALAQLRAAMSDPKRDPADLAIAVRILFQRFEHNGYRWKEVADGTPFDDAMRQEFDIADYITAGEPVRARRPALLRHDSLVQKGEIRLLDS